MTSVGEEAGRGALLVGVQSLQKTVWRVLKTLKMELPFDPAVSLLGI